MSEEITLSRKDVLEARQDFERNSKKSDSLPCLFSYEEERCRVRLRVLGLCRLCKKFTDFLAEKGPKRELGEEEPTDVQ